MKSDFPVAFFSRFGLRACAWELCFHAPRLHRRKRVVRDLQRHRCFCGQRGRWVPGLRSEAPKFTCPAVACHCTGGPAVSCAAATFPWSIALAAFLGGFLAALAVAWRLRVWAAGGWDVAGRFTLGSRDDGSLPPTPAAAAAPAPSAPSPPLWRIAGATFAGPPLHSVGGLVAALGSGAVDDLAVWKPRVR